MRRVTADSNVLVSGLMYRRGKPFQLLRMALEGEIRLTISEPIIEETLDVLGRKFGIMPDELPSYRATLEEARRKVRPAVILDVVKDDPDDNKILECAVSGGSDYIITGDRRLLRLGSYDAIKILTVSDFLGLGQER